MTNEILLKNSIETLKKFRDEIHDEIDSSKRAELDLIIKNLECCEPKKITAHQIIELFGKAIRFLPALEKILDVLDKL